jgi:hypothetical protein
MKFLMMKRLVFLLPLIFLRTVHSAELEQEDVSVKFVTVAWTSQNAQVGEARQMPDELFYRNGEDYELLVFQYQQIGSQQYYRGVEAFVLYTRSADAEGGWVYTPKGSCVFPQAEEVFLFIIPRESGDLLLLPLDFSRSNVSDGDMFFLNMTKFPLVAEIQSEREEIGPAQAKKFSLEADELLAYVPVKIAIYDEAWRLAYNLERRLPVDRPFLGVFFLQNNKKGAYRFRIFDTLDVLRSENDEGSSRFLVVQV